MNKRGYRDLVLATKQVSLTILGNAKTEDLSSGDLQLAWIKLEKRWDHKSREDRVDSLTKFTKLKLEDSHIKPQDWLDNMEKKKRQYQDDETYLTYVPASWPQEEYQTMILVIKEQLRNKY